MNSINIAGYRGQWANTSNDFIYFKNSEDKTTTLWKVGSPKFSPAVLLPDNLIDATLNTDFTWSPDDKTVLFACHPEGHPVTVCIMNSDVSNARMLNPEIQGMNYVFLYGWRDQKNLVFGLYSGGGHVNVYSVNIETGKLNPGRAFIHGYTFPSHNNFTPVTSDMSAFDSRLMVISDQFSERK